MSAFPKGLAFLFLVLSGSSIPRPGIAQTLRDEVADHVEDSLEKAKQDAGKKKGKKKSGKKDEAKSVTPVEGGGGEEEDEDEEEAAEADEGGEEDASDEETGEDVDGGAEEGSAPAAPRLPRRVFGKNFQLDLEAAAGYRGWTPQQYPTVAVEMGNYFTWSVSARAKFFDTVSLKRGYYESTNAASPRDSYLADAAKYGSYALKAAWFLAELGIPALKSWEPSIRYEARSFTTRARPDDGAGVCVIPFDTDADQAADGCTPTTGPLTVVSGFETAALGVRYYPEQNPTSVIDDRKWAPPSLFLGAGYLSYLKPYQVTIGEAVLDRYLFSGRFYGGGLALGGEIGGGVNHPYLDVWAQFGLGRVRLTQDMTLNELAPEDWLIGYVQGNLQLSYRWAPFTFAPSILLVPSGTVSGASFFFFETEAEEGEETATPSINWDVLYSVQLALVITL
jgi:hypothetical protein